MVIENEKYLRQDRKKYREAVKKEREIQKEIKEISQGSPFMKYMLNRYRWLYNQMIGAEEFEDDGVYACDSHNCSNPKDHRHQPHSDLLQECDCCHDIARKHYGCMTIGCKSHDDKDSIPEQCRSYRKEYDWHPSNTTNYEEWVSAGYHDNYLGILIHKRYEEKMQELCQQASSEVFPLHNLQIYAYLYGYCASYFPHNLRTDMSLEEFYNSITMNDIDSPEKIRIHRLHNLKINAFKYVFIYGTPPEDSRYNTLCDRIACLFRDAGLPGTIRFVRLKDSEQVTTLLEDKNPHKLTCQGRYPIALNNANCHVDPQVSAFRPPVSYDWPLSKLGEHQLLLLNCLVYIATAFPPGISVGTLVDELLGENLLPCLSVGGGMNYDEAFQMLQNIQKDDMLRNLVIESRIETRIRGVAFSYPNTPSEAVIAFQGTGPYYAAWDDNCQGGYLTDTEMQKEALRFVDSWLKTHHDGIAKKEYLVVTGHSKGGNLAQYVTVRRTRAVQRCVSFDGQGFADEFMNKYRKNVHNARPKIRSVCACNDYVNILLQPIASEIVYLYHDLKGFKAHYIYNLYKNPCNQLDANGRYMPVRDQHWATAFLKWCVTGITRWINTWWPLAEFWAYTFAGRLLARIMASDGDERAEIELEFARNVKDFVKQEFFQVDHYDQGHSNETDHCTSNEHDHQKH